MSVYSDLILSLNPVRYARCDESVAGVLTDSSTFAKHGTTDGLATFGLPSAIETDPGSSSIGGPAGLFPAAAGEEADLKGNFTWLYWIYYDASNPSGIAVCRRGQFGLANSVQAGINEDNLFADVTLDTGGAGTFYQLVSPTTLVDDTWYFGAVVRNATVLSLYLNADLGLGNQRSDLTTDDVDYNVEGTNWFIGRSVNTSAFSATRIDEVALFDYALNSAQITQIYEAALNALFLNGVSNVIPTAVLRSDFEPDPISFPFRHNWTEPLIERISFRTAISQSVTGIEEGYAERIAPRRELEITQVLKNQSERRRLRALLWANQHRKWFVPVRMYADWLAEPLTAGATVTPITTSWKDYEIGGWIGFRQIDGYGEIVHWEERLITSLNPSSVEHEALTNSYVANSSMVCPIRRALLPPSVSLHGYSDKVEEITLNFRLLVEDEAIIPNRITQFLPSIKYRDVEVFDGQIWQSNDWSENREYEVERAIEELDFDAGVFSYDSDTPGASEVFSYRMTLSGIDNIAAFLGWYYERIGALRYVWVPTMQEDFEVLSASGADLTVRDTNYSDAFALAEARRDLAFVYFDGSMEFRRVVGFSGATNETLELDALVPTLTNLRFVSLLKYCRLDADQIELAWHTDNKAVIAWRFREQLYTPEGTGVSSLSPSASMSLSASPSGSASPSSSVSPSLSPSLSPSPSSSQSPSSSVSRSPSPSSSLSPSSSASPSA